MGLYRNSVVIKDVASELTINRQDDTDKVIAIAGNPNVGKSTLFNNMTGLNQHTGNWPGKTVSNAQGRFKTKENSYVMVDIPGTYSLMAYSVEEEVARNFICFGNPDAVIVVCDATCLERNLNLALQTIEISNNVIICVNLMDEAKKKHISIDLNKLSEKLGVPVIGTVARKKSSIEHIGKALDDLTEYKKQNTIKIKYIEPIEKAIDIVEKEVKEKVNNMLNTRWISLRLIDSDDSLLEELNRFLGEDITEDKNIAQVINEAKEHLHNKGIDENTLKDIIVSSLVKTAEKICNEVQTYNKEKYNLRDRKIDKIFTSKYIGYPIMLLLLAVIFYITISGANYPSQMLSKLFLTVQEKIYSFFIYIGIPEWINNMLVLGVYNVLTWVVSVMLPPMAIFFPLFTILEDSGYLPRVAYNLDKPFKKCCACGKQALTMCMGFGCNAVGVVGCRIIDSPRERLIAMITNNFVPCNGRFPTLIAIITMFFIGVSGGITDSIFSALFLTLIIVIGIVFTFFVSKMLSKTILKGVPSSFTLELPPYRRPQFLKVIVRSIFDRTLFVLGRAVSVAAPAGLIIWLMSNVMIKDISILNHCTDFLDPFAKIFGLDGVILMAFILGLPANEIVFPVIIMTYMSKSSLVSLEDLSVLKDLLVDNGWTWITAISTMLFSLMHWPCATTLLTIKKETGSLKWTLISLLIPTISGFLICALFASIARLL